MYRALSLACCCSLFFFFSLLGVTVAIQSSVFDEPIDTRAAALTCDEWKNKASILRSQGSAASYSERFAPTCSQYHWCKVMERQGVIERFVRFLYDSAVFSWCSKERVRGPDAYADKAAIMPTSRLNWRNPDFKALLLDLSPQQWEEEVWLGPLFIVRNRLLEQHHIFLCCLEPFQPLLPSYPLANGAADSKSEPWQVELPLILGWETREIVCVTPGRYQVGFDHGFERNMTSSLSTTMTSSTAECDDTTLGNEEDHKTI
jgi:hypothetical protein